MNLLDVREPDGPYWAAYQEERAREGIVDNPDFVPEWFLIKLMKDRLAAARVALEQVQGTREPTPYYEMKRAWQAIKTLEEFIGSGSDPFGARQQVLAGLLGAQEIETARERVWAEERKTVLVVNCPGCIENGEPSSDCDHYQGPHWVHETWEQCGTACHGGYGSAPERCAYPVGHEGECQP